MDDSPHPAMGSTTLLEVLNELRSDGYKQQLIAQEDATVRCTACNTNSPATDLAVDGYRRLEGASDAADMNIVAWAQCPSCKAAAIVTLGYGPNASRADEAVILDLDLDAADSPGATPEESA